MSPVHCAIWPRCLYVLLKYLTAVRLVSGVRLVKNDRVKHKAVTRC